MKTYVKLMVGLPLTHASRNRREISAAREAGFRTVVIFDEPDFVPGSDMEGTELVQFHKRDLPDGLSFTAKWRFILKEWNRVGEILKAQKADVISCHNLPNLQIAWFVTRTMHPRPKLIYDSHEFDLGQRGIRREKEREKHRRMEKFLMNRCAFSIMVNDSIAEAVQRIHGLREKPVVVRSTPHRWTLDESVMAENRARFLRDTGMGENAFLVMYHGGTTGGCGIEYAIRSVSRDPDMAFVLIGMVDPEYRDSLLSLAEECGAGGRVKFYPPVPGNELWKVVGAADVGIMPVENICESYYLTLPNKFFENVQSLTPMICSDFPEMARLIKEYDIGLLCDMDDPDSLYHCLREMRTNRERYAEFKHNLLRAKEELCWEKEKQVLFDAFEKYL